MKTPMVEHSAGLAASYAAGDVEAMWRARDAQVPMGHMGDAWDVANAALFLASDESKYVTGMELIVDGGITLKAGARSTLSSSSPGCAAWRRPGTHNHDRRVWIPGSRCARPGMTANVTALPALNSAQSNSSSSR